MPHVSLLAACLLTGATSAAMPPRPPAGGLMPQLVADHQAEQHARDAHNERLHQESLNRLDANRQQAQARARSQQIQQLDRRR